jgi:hypothetical protein
MKGKLVMDNVHKIRDKIVQENKIIKRIDFEKDINKEKSGKYYLNSNNGVLEFVCDVSSTINKDNYIIVFGNAEFYEKGIRLVPTKNDIFEDDIERAGVLVKKPVQFKQTGIILINFEVDDYSNGYSITLCDQLYYNLLHKIKKEKIKHIPPYDSIRIMSTFINQRFDLRKYIGIKYDEKDFISLPIKEKDLTYLIDLQEGYVKINFITQKIFYKCLMMQQDVYPFFLCNHKGRMFIKDIIYGTKEGYIYFNPIKVQFEQLQIMMLYSGSPVIEYFCDKQNKWLKINDQEFIKVSDKLNLRSKMTTEDKIFDLFITKKI